MTKRRDFLSTAVAVAAGLAARSTRAADGFVEVLLTSPLARLRRNSGQFFRTHWGGYL